MNINLSIPELTEALKQIELILQGQNELRAKMLKLEKELLPSVEGRRYSVNDLAKLLKVSRQTVYRLFAEGLQYGYIGRRRYVTVEQLERFIKADLDRIAKYKH